MNLPVKLRPFGYVWIINPINKIRFLYFEFLLFYDGRWNVPRQSVSIMVDAVWVYYDFAQWWAKLLAHLHTVTKLTEKSTQESTTTLPSSVGRFELGWYIAQWMRVWGVVCGNRFCTPLYIEIVQNYVYLFVRSRTHIHVILAVFLIWTKTKHVLFYFAYIIAPRFLRCFFGAPLGKSNH